MEVQQQMINQQSPQSMNQDTESTISLRDIVFLVINNWYWFALSLFVCLVIAGVVYKTKPKTYEYRTTIMVRDESSRNYYQYRNMDAILNSMGDDMGSHSLENEIHMMRSSSLAKNVVTKYGLNKTCSRNGLFTKISYYKDSPLEMKVYTQYAENSEVNLTVEVTPLDMSRYEYNVRAAGKKGVAYFTEPVALSNMISFTIDKTPYFTKNNFNVKYDMSECPVMTKAYQVVGSLSVSRVDKVSSVLAIVYTDKNEARARDVANAIVEAYNEDGINDKNQIAEKTEQFVSDRIALISGELEDVDSQVEQLKKSSRLPDLTSASGTLLQTGTRYTDEVVSLEAELSITKDIRSYLSDPANREELLPANVGISNAGVQSMISQYNQQVLEYRKLLNTAGPQNPQVREKVQRMDANRAAIITSVDNLINSLQVKLRNARQQEARAQGQISAMPTQTKAVTEVTRQQKIKEELYLYLLSKREENAMNLAVTVENAKIVEPAKRSNLGPHLSMHILVGLIIGIALPALIKFL